MSTPLLKHCSVLLASSFLKLSSCLKKVNIIAGVFQSDHLPSADSNKHLGEIKDKQIESNKTKAKATPNGAKTSVGLLS